MSHCMTEKFWYADCDAVVQSARGAAGHDALLARSGHVERGLHLRRARAQGVQSPSTCCSKL